MAHSYGGTAAMWKRPVHHHQPSEPAALRLLGASEAAGSHNYVIVIDHFLAYMLGKVTALGVLCCFALFVCLTLLASFFLPSHLSFKNMHIRRGYKKYTWVGDFDPPTHQPTSEITRHVSQRLM